MSSTARWRLASSRRCSTPEQRKRHERRPAEPAFTACGHLRRGGLEFARVLPSSACDSGLDCSAIGRASSMTDLLEHADRAEAVALTSAKKPQTRSDAARVIRLLARFT